MYLHPIKVMNRLLNEINRLISKGMPNIYLVNENTYLLRKSDNLIF